MTKLTDETIKGDCYVSLIRDNEDGSSDFQFNFPPEALAALTRLGILTAINAGIAEAECLNPDTNLEQEPLGWHTEDHLNDRSATTYSKEMAYRWECKGWPVTPFYTSPPKRQPLTDEQIADIVIEMNGNEPTGLFWRDLTRAIEAAHGIGDRT